MWIDFFIIAPVSLLLLAMLGFGWLRRLWSDRDQSH